MLTLMQQQEPGRRWEGAKEGGRVPKQQGGPKKRKIWAGTSVRKGAEGGVRNGGCSGSQ